MKKRQDLKVIFKAYNQQQVMLLPPSLDELISANHPVRVVNKVLDQIDIVPLIAKYKVGGTSSFHPRMLLKVLVFAYINNIYSSRKIEEALQQNIHFMWLSAMSTPDHNTINRFRSERLKDVLRQIFTQVVELLAQEGLLSIKELYTDGTKIEANANRYTFVWGNAIKTNKEKIKKQLDELWQYAQKVAAREMDDTDPSGFDKIDAEKVEQAIEKINEALKDKPVSKEVKQKLSYAKKNWPANLRKYEEQEKIMGEERNSYSKTDTDATFMRMKEDHMKNGQLKPAYNVQISTNNQIIASYSVHQKTTDTNTLIAHLDQHEKDFGQKPQVVTADAGYGSEENYQYLEDNNITGYVKHNQFDRQQNETIRDKKPFASEKLYYNKEKDCYYCPMGQPMNNIATTIRKTSTGFKQQVTIYQARNCQGCPLRGVCHKAKTNRTIEINHNLKRLKHKADELLLSEEGQRHRKQRPCDVEPVFGNIKNNHHFKRFMLRGIEKVSIETGLLALAHNLRKRAA
ncbi:MAG: Transposase, IS4 family [uncultured Segetibacter sp.]|uniref:Transposase, IS4 family n=1 Tax=uncultured Segetibacter sp. TaxID=481133 RepID=A0A6J4SES9_9BACT|nr:MAG: Transposase, IS4 family [uncultured Segetibacter sp.]